MLLFDEADCMFRKRIEVNNANDRFTKVQTNYLLQRIETCNGIVILTSNHQAVFAMAFKRRLVIIIDFPLPYYEGKYVPGYRTVIMLRKSIPKSIQWAVFEPNDESLWSALWLNIGSFMNNMFRTGVFQGSNSIRWLHHAL